MYTHTYTYTYIYIYIYIYKLEIGRRPPQQAGRRSSKPQRLRAVFPARLLLPVLRLAVVVAVRPHPCLGVQRGLYHWYYCCIIVVTIVNMIIISIIVIISIIIVATIIIGVQRGLRTMREVGRALLKRI